MTETRAEYSEDMNHMLAQLAQRLEGDSHFMASILMAHRRQEGLSEDAQRQLLGVAQLGYLRLALCRRPAADPGSFRTQVEQIARFSGANVATLVQIIRRVDAVESMEPRTLAPDDQRALAGQRARAAGVGVFAARDHILEETEPYDSHSATDAQPDSSPTAAPSPDRKANRDDTASDLPTQTPDAPTNRMA